mgnify:CR=1 FL=1
MTDTHKKLFLMLAAVGAVALLAALYWLYQKPSSPRPLTQEEVIESLTAPADPANVRPDPALIKSISAEKPSQPKPNASPTVDANVLQSLTVPQ